MKVLIIGSEGSMGKRYQAILKHLNVRFDTYDKAKDQSFDFNAKADAASHYIVASPTATHHSFLLHLSSQRKPILCEKPVITDLKVLDVMLNILEANNCPFSMMYQYARLADLDYIGPSYYDYFRTGPDGLKWDCLQIIGLAKSEVLIDNKSPIWTCKINGQILNLSDMDKAYVDSVKAFLAGIYVSKEEIFRVHKKTAEFEAFQ